jgi:hypothetical protein
VHPPIDPFLDDFWPYVIAANPLSSRWDESDVRERMIHPTRSQPWATPSPRAYGHRSTNASRHPAEKNPAQPV